MVFGRQMYGTGIEKLATYLRGQIRKVNSKSKVLKIYLEYHQATAISLSWITGPPNLNLSQDN